MGRWIFSFCIIAIETWGSVYFFETFMDRKRTGWLDKCRYAVLYIFCFVVACLGGYYVPIGIKVLLMVLILMAFCAVFYKADWKQCIFFSGLNYSLLFLTDLFMLQMENMFVSDNDVLTFLLLPSKMTWLCVVFIVRKVWKGRNNYGEISRKEWLKFSMIPLLTVASMLFMFFCKSAEAKVQTAYLFLSVGLIFINILVIELMQGILEKEELLRESALAGQKKESQIAHYRDVQAVYERQGRNAVIHVKLVQEGGKLIFSVRNPVVEKVEVTEGTGLSNVKAVADKYGGDFAVSCDAEKFQAVVML